MSASIKDKLVSALEALHRPELTPVIEKLKRQRLSRDSDVNMTLTALIVLEVIAPHPDIMSDPDSERLREISAKIGHAKPSTRVRLSAKETRLARLFFGNDLQVIQNEIAETRQPSNKRKR